MNEWDSETSYLIVSEKNNAMPKAKWLETLSAQGWLLITSGKLKWNAFLTYFDQWLKQPSKNKSMWHYLLNCN